MVGLLVSMPRGICALAEHDHCVREMESLIESLREEISTIGNVCVQLGALDPRLDELLLVLFKGLHKTNQACTRMASGLNSWLTTPSAFWATSKTERCPFHGKDPNQTMVCLSLVANVNAHLIRADLEPLKDPEKPQIIRV